MVFRLDLAAQDAAPLVRAVRQEAPAGVVMLVVGGGVAREDARTVPQEELWRQAMRNVVGWQAMRNVVVAGDAECCRVAGDAECCSLQVVQNTVAWQAMQNAVGWQANNEWPAGE